MVRKLQKKRTYREVWELTRQRKHQTEEAMIFYSYAILESFIHAISDMHGATSVMASQPTLNLERTTLDSYFLFSRSHLRQILSNIVPSVCCALIAHGPAHWSMIWCDIKLWTTNTLTWQASSQTLHSTKETRALPAVVGPFQLSSTQRTVASAQVASPNQLHSTKSHSSKNNDRGTPLTILSVSGTSIEPPRAQALSLQLRNQTERTNESHPLHQTLIRPMNGRNVHMLRLHQLPETTRELLSSKRLPPLTVGRTSPIRGYQNIPALNRKPEEWRQSARQSNSDAYSQPPWGLSSSSSFLSETDL